MKSLNLIRGPHVGIAIGKHLLNEGVRKTIVDATGFETFGVGHVVARAFNVAERPIMPILARHERTPSA